MEMPTPCVGCNEWFDLNDGFGSDILWKGITVCPECHQKEQSAEILIESLDEIKEEIEELEYGKKLAEQRIPILEKKKQELIERHKINYELLKSKGLV